MATERAHEQAVLAAAIHAIERAAWARSWSQLKRARKALREAHGLDVHGDPGADWQQAEQAHQQKGQ